MEYPAALCLNRESAGSAVRNWGSSRSQTTPGATLALFPECTLAPAIFQVGLPLQLFQVGLPFSFFKWDSPPAFPSGTPLQLFQMGFPSRFSKWDFPPAFPSGTPLQLFQVALPSSFPLLCPSLNQPLPPTSHKAGRLI